MTVLVIGNNVKDILSTIFYNIEYKMSTIVYFTNNQHHKKVCRELYLQNTEDIQNKIESIVFNTNIFGKKNMMTICPLDLFKKDEKNSFVYLECFFLTDEIVEDIKKKKLTDIILSNNCYSSTRDSFARLCN